MVIDFFSICIDTTVLVLHCLFFSILATSSTGPPLPYYPRTVYCSTVQCNDIIIIARSYSSTILVCSFLGAVLDSAWWCTVYDYSIMVADVMK